MSLDITRLQYYNIEKKPYIKRKGSHLIMPTDVHSIPGLCLVLEHQSPFCFAIWNLTQMKGRVKHVPR